MGNNGDGYEVLPESSTLYHPSSMSRGRTFKPDYVERHDLARSNLHETLSTWGWISGLTCLPVTLVHGGGNPPIVVAQKFSGVAYLQYVALLACYNYSYLGHAVLRLDPCSSFT